MTKKIPAAAKYKNDDTSFYDQINNRRRVAIAFDQPSLTKQSFKDEADINQIISKYKQTGALPVNRKTGEYRDNENVSYQEALNMVLYAREEFEKQPSEVRKKFENDPYQMLDWLSNEENREEAVELGLIEAIEAVPEQPVDPIDPPVSPQPSGADSPPEG